MRVTPITSRRMGTADGRLPSGATILALPRRAAEPVASPRGVRSWQQRTRFLLPRGLTNFRSIRTTPTSSTCWRPARRSNCGGTAFARPTRRQPARRLLLRAVAEITAGAEIMVVAQTITAGESPVGPIAALPLAPLRMLVVTIPVPVAVAVPLPVPLAVPTPAVKVPMVVAVVASLVASSTDSS